VKFWVKELQQQEASCRIYICCTKQVSAMIFGHGVFFDVL
jgi:hypothetical protein